MANLKAAAMSAQTTLAGSRALIKSVKQTLRLMFANDIVLLATFGLAPVKEPHPKPATKVEAAAKAKATRQARGTDLGKKQRAAIKAPAATNPVPTTKPTA